MNSSIVRSFATLALAAFATACASTSGGSTAVDPSQLVAAGFKTIEAKTPTQLERLQTLPTGKFTEWQNTGKHYYVYPDAANKQVYVGRPAEYQAYLKLSGATGGPSLAQQSATDLSSYAKQDSGMSMLTKRDNDDPYWWSLDNIGFR